ncbi:thiamine ABC transporter substrate binding subunit [Enterobacillus tribolii]|uniref:Thiamine-binding periplasmic protein n=1 Tax=Enterobacillus tribolii TaxID=1487935 RepID=A0A370QQ62_9GAMM|nr:thiamine ABC transporter substrate binding subunit [Enterobacillus tribolii]MBW7981468.1 thiamine ABC transporter substrate binding subunit [Enterobacillus tribolii]RDK90845.1 thiamine transport system substrate-binding protein [Enterobacillus tribolii]
MLKRLIPALLLTAAPLWSHAAERPTLTVYTYDSFAADWGPGPKIKAAFEKECGCTLKLIALEDGVSILNRLRMEGKNSPADVVLGLDNNLAAAAEKTGLFSPSGTDTQAVALPGGWHDKTFVPYDYGYFAFVYNKDTLKTPPASLKELVESPQPWKIIYEDPRTSTPGQGLLLWMQKVFGDETPQAWQKLAQKTVTVTKGWSEAYGLFLKGEADMVLSYTTSPAYHLIEEKKNNYAAANFSEGHYLQVEIAGKLAAGKHPELAQKFLRFILTPAFQDAMPTGNWMYPVINTPLPAGFEQMTVPAKALEFTPQQVAQQRAGWIQAWQTAVSR